MRLGRVLRRHKFALTLGVVVLAFVGLVVGHLASGGSVEPNQFTLRSYEAPAEGGTNEDYVGYIPGSFDPAVGYDPARVDAALADWQRAHDPAKTVEAEPVWSGAHIIGYTIRYQD